MSADSLKAFSSSLRALPRVLAQKVATASAPAITALALQTFDAHENAFGDSWTPGVDGRTVTLRKSGALFAQIRYVAIGTLIRVALGVPYAKYQIGKRPIFPRAGAPLPPAYAAALARAAQIEILAELGK